MSQASWSPPPVPPAADRWHGRSGAPDLRRVPKSLTSSSRWTRRGTTWSTRAQTSDFSAPSTACRPGSPAPARHRATSWIWPRCGAWRPAGTAAASTALISARTRRVPPTTSVPSACTGPSGGSTTDVEASSIPAPVGLRHERICGPLHPSGSPFATELVRRLCPPQALNQQVSETEWPRTRNREPTQVPGTRPAGLPETGHPAAGPPPRGELQATYAVTGEQVREWAFLGWCALIDTGKCLRRGSLGEAHSRLHEARHHIWVRWAVAHGVLYPWHGLSQVLDHDPGNLPPGIESTVAGLDAPGLRQAARASAKVLTTASEAAARRYPADLPAPMAAYVTGRLSREP